MAKNTGKGKGKGGSVVFHGPVGEKITGGHYKNGLHFDSRCEPCQKRVPAADIDPETPAAVRRAA